MRWVKTVRAVLLRSDNDLGYVVTATGRSGALELWESESAPGMFYARFYYLDIDEFPDMGPSLYIPGSFRTTRGTVETDGKSLVFESNHRYEFEIISECAGEEIDALDHDSLSAIACKPEIKEDGTTVLTADWDDDSDGPSER